MGKPGKVQAIAIYSLIVGILNCLYGLFMIVYGGVAGVFTFGFGCLLWILVPLPLITGVLELVYASKLLPQAPEPIQPFKVLAILEISNILCCNVLPMVAGILSLIFYTDPKVTEYLSQQKDSPQV